MTWPRKTSSHQHLIVLFTKDNVGRIEKLDHLYSDPPCDVVMLDDSTTEIARETNKEFADIWNIHYHGPNNYRNNWSKKEIEGKVISELGRDGWTLGNCRNYALLMANKYDWEKIIMIDDDINFRSWEKPMRDFNRLDDFPFIGSNITNMPDSSIVGYLFRSSGIIDETFLSGAYLGICIEDIEYAFPNIYNEDWIWAFRHQSKESIPLFGSVTQLEYDWTKNAIEDARFQEFGEVIIDGMLRAEREDITYNVKNPDFWEKALQWREQKIQTLDERSVPSELSEIKSNVINEINSIHSELKPRDIINEIDSWEKFNWA